MFQSRTHSYAGALTVNLIKMIVDDTPENQELLICETVSQFIRL